MYSLTVISKDEWIKRLTANDIVGHFFKHKELGDLEERIKRIEERKQCSKAAHPFDGHRQCQSSMLW